ncbi:tail completion protein gp17 [Hymenobacter sp. HD11105]
MEPGQLIFKLLKENAAVAALVAQRIQPLRLAQGLARPAIIYQQISCVPGRCDGYDRLRYQLTLYASSYEVLTQLARAVRRALHGYEEGEIYIEFDQEIDGFDNPADLYSRHHDYLLDFPNPLTS